MKTRKASSPAEFRGAKVSSETTSGARVSRRESLSAVVGAGKQVLKKNRCLRATDREWAEIGERARQAGYTRSAFLLTAALSGRPRPRPDQPTRDALYHLARVGQNLNQIAHAANTPNRIVDEGRLHRVLDEIVLWLEAHS